MTGLNNASPESLPSEKGIDGASKTELEEMLSLNINRSLPISDTFVLER